MAVDIAQIVKRLEKVKTLQHGDGHEQDEADELLKDAIKDLNTLIDDGR